MSYEPFINQLLHNLRTAEAADEVIAEVQSAAAKAAMLFDGSPVGTMLRNEEEKVSAQRVLDSEGRPQWALTYDTGATTVELDAVLTPEDKWKCVWKPGEADS